MNIKSFILFLTEANIEHLAQMHHTVPVKEYANKDPSKNKKFLPWLISQHKKGKLKIDQPELSLVLNNFDRLKHKHNMIDHNHYDFKDVSDKILPLLSDRLKEKLKEDVSVGSGQIAGIGIDNSNIPNQAEPGVKRKRKPLTMIKRKLLP